MKVIRLICLLASTACLTLAPPSASAQAAAQPAVEAQKPPAALPTVRVVDTSAANNEAVVSMAFEETPLADVIKAFRTATSANIISGGTNLQGTVSVRLDNVPWKKGLSSILDPQGLQLVETPPNSGIYVVTPKVATEIPKITQTFTLSHMRAEEVATLFKSTLGTSGTVTAFPSANVVIVTASEQQIGECEKIIAVIDKPRSQVYIEARFVELTAAASKKLGLKWDGLKEWGVNVQSVAGGMSYNKSQLATYRTGTKSVEDSTTLLPGETDKYIKEYVETVMIPDTLNASTRSGATADDQSWRRTRGIGGMISADDFRLALSAFEQMDGASVFSNPKVIVANEETARVDMTTKEPNVELTFQAATSDNGSDSISTKLALIPGKEEPFVGEAFFSYGISLKVTPRISSTGLITVEIEPSISELVKYFELQGIGANIPAAKFPVIEIRRIKTTFTMDDGKTAVIGGLTRTSEENIDSGIPWLRKLPWVGPRLFGWKSREKEQREIIVFVTVGIADPVEMKEDVGMPKNAMLGREMMKGNIKEPGDRTREELLDLDETTLSGLGKRAEPAAEPAAATEAEAEKK